MKIIELSKFHNFSYSFTNENGVNIRLLFHTFRGITYMSMIANDYLIVASQPCIQGSKFASLSVRRQFGSFEWISRANAVDYPIPSDYNDLFGLLYYEPSEVKE